MLVGSLLLFRTLLQNYICVCLDTNGSCELNRSTHAELFVCVLCTVQPIFTFTYSIHIFMMGIYIFLSFSVTRSPIPKCPNKPHQKKNPVSALNKQTIAGLFIADRRYHLRPNNKMVRLLERAKI